MLGCGSSPEEGGDENAGVEVQRGVPPPVREIQQLSRADGALQRGLLFRQRGVGLPDPGQSAVVRVEVRLFVWRVEEPALASVDDL